MWGVFGILLVGVFLACLEVPSLRRPGYRKDLIVFSVLLIFGISLACAKVLNAPIPNPGDWIAALFRPLSDAFSPLLH
ncbi:hypothetical protein EDM59_15070 [Brevibacillus nitrificans]|uniref:Uncharacterized protein n=1 Tax=Brevibacillus nitrificans TaxID=651560 RepID=A0A3M8D7L7_9BACL|nr:hypothetical protein [Brevibacillus nitrificans]RNB83843.1 hypothetical protein EDM59_15070 [Brevibacillus nitrificans]